MNQTKYRHLFSAVGLAAIVAAGTSTASAQIAYFTNQLGGDWNVPANWDLDFTGVNVVPAEGTNVNLGTFGAVTVNYDTPMAATSFGGMTIDSGVTLNVNAVGFNQDQGISGVSPLLLGSGIVNVGAGGVWNSINGGTVTINLGGTLNVSGKALFAATPLGAPLAINTGGAVNVLAGGELTVADGGANTVVGALTVNAGSLVLSNSQALIVSPGATITVVGGTFLQTNSTGGVIAFGVNNNNTTTLFQMESGTVTFDTLLDIRGRKAGFIMNGGTLNCLAGSQLRETSTDDINRLVINGGVANLGNFEVHRTTSGGGLIVSNGVVNTASLRVGRNNSQSYATVWGGAVTNTGAFTVSDRSNAATSGERRARFLLRGGTVVSTGVEGIVVANQANAAVGGSATSIAGILDVNAGNLFAEGITLVRDNTLTNAHAVFNLAGSGIVYLGALGLTGNVGPINSSYAINMTGGTLAAQNNYAINANIALTGTTSSFQTSDAANTPFNVAVNGSLTGSGALTKNGNGVLTLEANNTYSGVTFVNVGTLALGVVGAIPNSPSITIASGAVLDVAAVGGGYVLNANRSLLGGGTVNGDVTMAAAAIINPGTSGAPETLTLGGSLTQTGGAVNHFDLTETPGPGNDQVVIGQDLNVSGVNTIEVVGGGVPGTVYPLFQYGGNFNGTLANFVISGAGGTLSNNPTTKTISLIIQSAIRNPTSVVWVGNATSNHWATLTPTNWFNPGTSQLDYFVNDDDALFSDLGAANSNVSIVGNVLPATLTVGATANYTFGGAGAIGGTTGLTKTNTGTLTVNTTNTYTGPTTLSGGVLEAAQLAIGGAPSAIGAAPSGSANLVFGGGTLRYTGDSVSSDRGATLNAAGGTIDVTGAATSLTISGVLTGDGALRKAGAGTLTLSAANNYTNGTTIDGGVLQINAASLGAGNITNNGATLRLNTSTTVGNALEWNGICTLDLNNVGGNQALDGAWSGSGTVNIINQQNNTRTFTVGGNGSGGGNLWNFSGTLNFGANDGTLRFNDGGGTGSGPNFGSSNAVFNLGTGTAIFVVRNGGTTTYLGALLGGPNTRLSGRSSSSGTATYVIGGKNTDAIFEGTIQDTDTLSGQLTVINKVGTGKWTLTGNSTYTGATTVSEGTLQVDGSLGNTAVTVAGAAEATLSGSGTINGPVTVNFMGNLAPGSSIGQMTINNSLTLFFGSTNVMELDKANGTNDSIVGLSFVTYGGELIVTNLGGTLAAGDTFKLFDAVPGNYFGAFDAIVLPPLGPSLSWETNNLAIDGTISVVGPQPPLNFVNNGTSIDFSWSGSFKLQVQTNALSTGLSGNWVDYPGGDSSPVNVAIDPNAPAVFFRLAEQIILSE